MRESGKEFLSLIRRRERWYIGHRVVVLRLWATLRWGKDLVGYDRHSFQPFQGIPVHMLPELCIIAKHCEAARLSIK